MHTQQGLQCTPAGQKSSKYVLLLMHRSHLALLTVDEKNVREAALHQRRCDIPHHPHERCRGQRNRSRERGMVRRHAVVDGRGQKHASDFRHPPGDRLHGRGQGAEGEGARDHTSHMPRPSTLRLCNSRTERYSGFSPAQVALPLYIILWSSFSRCYRYANRNRHDTIGHAA